MTPILSNLPGIAFTVAVGPGNIYSGGAVAFSPKQDCTMISVTLLLRGYTEQMVPHFTLQLLTHGNDDKPTDTGLPSFIKPAPNDGTQAEIDFNLAANAALKSGVTYWILAYGNTLLQPIAPAVSSWMDGSLPVGDAKFVKSLGFVRGDFIPSSKIPAFKINVE